MLIAVILWKAKSKADVVEEIELLDKYWTDRT
jgi:hypothetical protein